LALNKATEAIDGKDANTGLEKAWSDDKKAYEALVLATAAAKKAFDDDAAKWTVPLAARAKLVEAVAAEELVTTKAWADLQAKEGEITKALGAEQVARKALLGAVVACKSAEYDRFRKVLAAAVTDRDQKLAAIAKLPVKTIARGKDGGRCEKPMTNGDWARRGKCEDEEKLCCGAATGLAPNGATMVIEVCQDKTKETYGYVGPRAPMATALPAKVDLPFKCIGGAKQLAGAAAALLASVYMMA